MSTLIKKYFRKIIPLILCPKSSVDVITIRTSVKSKKGFYFFVSVRCDGNYYKCTFESDDDEKTLEGKYNDAKLLISGAEPKELKGSVGKNIVQSLPFFIQYFEIFSHLTYRISFTSNLIDFTGEEFSNCYSTYHYLTIDLDKTPTEIKRSLSQKKKEFDSINVENAKKYLFMWENYE